MNETEFINLCKEKIIKYVNTHLDNKTITNDNVCVIWTCKILQGNRALLNINFFHGMYYECIYNGDKLEIYLTYISNGKIIKLII